MDVDLLRTRVLLEQMQGEQERLAASLELTGLTDFADRADWLIERRTADEQLAWRRHWARLGIRNAEPQPLSFTRPASLAHHRARRSKHPVAIDPARALDIALAVYDSKPADVQNQWASARRPSAVA